MTEKPNCGNCPNQYTDKCSIDYKDCLGNSDVFKGMDRVRNHCLMGCHPNTGAYLMAPVIKELERLESLHDINKTDDKEEIGLSIAYGVAISLIRNGCDNK